MHFYIGKGCGDRVVNHKDVAKLTEESIVADDYLSEEVKKKKNKQQTEKIKIFFEDGGPVN